MGIAPFEFGYYPLFLLPAIALLIYLTGKYGKTLERKLNERYGKIKGGLILFGIFLGIYGIVLLFAALGNWGSF